ncbi:MAG TPA: hypothetical protein VF245_07525 [Solirubrobacterales bacterium]
MLAATATAALACLSPKPTSLSTSLTGGGKEGAEITVSEGTGVKDTATLSGENAGKATGTVHYAVYSDAKCEKLVTKAGSVTVKEGKVPASEEEKLEAAAVYYWQAEYLGDSLDEASKSACGKEVLTVKAKTSLATTLSGGGKEGEEITVSEGSKVKDTATLSGTKASSATGTVHYAVYKDKECKELATKAGEGKVEGTKAAGSEEKGLEAAAVYYWQAEYLGDSLHEKSTSPCTEKLTVKAATSISTSLSGEGEEGEAITVSEGSNVDDTATLAGTKVSTATGTVAYAVYEDPKCEELVAEAGEVEVEGSKAGSSEEEELEGGLVYYWQATYGGDALHEGSTSACTEVLHVKAPTTVTTTLSGEGEEGATLTMKASQKAKDLATLSGAHIVSATGAVGYLVYVDSACEELVAEGGEAGVVEGTAEASQGLHLAPGTYYWQAVYYGDPLHERSTSTCGSEVEHVESPQLSLTTSLTGEGQTGNEIEIAGSSEASDTATLTGEEAATATGTVTYGVYADEECEELVSEAGEVTVTGGVVPSSEEIGLPSGATYYWQATYSGDEIHEATTSVCGEEVEAVAETTSLSTVLSGTDESGEELEPGDEIEVTEGTVVSDAATLSGGKASTATGWVDYLVYEDENCEKLVTDAGVVSVAGEEVPESGLKLLPGGTYYWQAVYSGDPANQPSKSPCGSEVEKVVSDDLSTVLTGEGLSGEEIEVQDETPVTDTATLEIAESSTATGTVTYGVYADEECEELVSEAGEVTVTGGVVPSSEEVALPIGTYYWEASYSGDMTHGEIVEECGEEIEKAAAATTLTTSLSGGGESGEVIEVPENTAVTDTAVVSGKESSGAAGAVEYFVFSDNECQEAVTEAGEASVEAGTAESSEAVKKLGPGAYYWQAFYTGDSSNQPSTSACGSEIEKVLPAAVTTSLSGGEASGREIEVQEHVPVTDSATLHGETVAAGKVEYSVYADAKCETLVTTAGEPSVKEGEELPSSSPLELPEGTYYWQARYKNEATEKFSSSICGTEVLEVQAPVPWVVSVGDSYISGEGGRWAGNVKWNHLELVTRHIDALGQTAYKNPENGEDLGEKIPGCHRSRSAEIFFHFDTNGDAVQGRNLACSGALTKSEGFVRDGNQAFLPGLDFEDVPGGQPLKKGGDCPAGLAACEGQALQLKRFAEKVKPAKIKMVVVSIGGNDFEFRQVVEGCAFAYFKRKQCRVQQNPKFEPPVPEEKRTDIETGIEKIGEAMERAEYQKKDYTIIVQDYEAPLPHVGAGFRYKPPMPARRIFWRRARVARCPFGDLDAEWAYTKALATIDRMVREAAHNVAGRGRFDVKLMELEKAFDGQRLCENGVNLVGRAPNPDDWWEPGAAQGSEWLNQVRYLDTLAPFQIQEDFHPNFWGQLALRNCLRRVYSNGKPKEAGCVTNGRGLEGGKSWQWNVHVKPTVLHPLGKEFPYLMNGEPKMQLTMLPAP